MKPMAVIRSEKGFTLIEVIISIAALSLISVFILQMFIISSRLSRDADDIDNAALAAQSVCEMLRLPDTAAVVATDVNYSKAVLEKKDTGTSLVMYYDAAWISCEPGANARYRVQATKNLRASPTDMIATSLPVSLDSTSAQAVTGQIYDINVRLHRLPSQSSKNEVLLCAYNTSRYYVQSGH